MAAEMMGCKKISLTTLSMIQLFAQVSSCLHYHLRKAPCTVKHTIAAILALSTVTAAFVTARENLVTALKALSLWVHRDEGGSSSKDNCALSQRLETFLEFHDL